MDLPNRGSILSIPVDLTRHRGRPHPRHRPVPPLSPRPQRRRPRRLGGPSVRLAARIHRIQAQRQQGSAHRVPARRLPQDRARSKSSCRSRRASTASRAARSSSRAGCSTATRCWPKPTRCSSSSNRASRERRPSARGSSAGGRAGGTAARTARRRPRLSHRRRRRRPRWFWLVGILAIPYPGPGWAIVFVGLGILATEFEWARQLLAYARSATTR